VGWIVLGSLVVAGAVYFCFYYTPVREQREALTKMAPSVKHVIQTPLELKAAVAENYSELFNKVGERAHKIAVWSKNGQEADLAAYAPYFKELSQEYLTAHNKLVFGMSPETVTELTKVSLERVLHPRTGNPVSLR
jgi:hypothetical protein